MRAGLPQRPQPRKGDRRNQEDDGDAPAERESALIVETADFGGGLALAISFSIVVFSPVTQATPEIIARTRPIFFDLLVAVFSGLAGGYAVINRKGATIVGVAIATALTPPLAVVGNGLASQSPATEKGVNANATGEYHSFRQSAKERELGVANFQRVDIGIANSVN